MADQAKVDDSRTVRHLNQVEVARRWCLSPKTLERWRWLGVGPPYLKLGGRVAYRIEDVMAWETERLTAPASDGDAA